MTACAYAVLCLCVLSAAQHMNVRTEPVPRACSGPPVKAEARVDKPNWVRHCIYCTKGPFNVLMALMNLSVLN